MDPFSKRLRKQRERSSLHARQLNKNALSLLHRQLRDLERRKEQQARTLNRSRQALLQELSDAEEPEHQGEMEKKTRGEDVHHHHHHQQQRVQSQKASRGSLPQLHTKTAAAEERHSFPPSSSSLSIVTEHQKQLPGIVNLMIPSADPPHPLPSTLQSCSSSSLNSDQALSHSFSRRHDGDHYHHHHHHHGTDNCAAGQQVCRFQALSHISPCPYFPCSRPHTYHRLRVSDCDVGLPDVVIPLRSARTQEAGDRSHHHHHHHHHQHHHHQQQLTTTSVKSPRTVLQSMGALTTSDPAFSELSLDTSGGDSGGGGEEQNGGGGTGGGKNMGGSTSLSRKVDSGHVSPRTSVNEKLRGLRQLVRELRQKNEEKRPRAWAVNYGEPVNRRLLRKPVIPVTMDD